MLNFNYYHSGGSESYLQGTHTIPDPGITWFPNVVGTSWQQSADWILELEDDLIY
tara:strand:+ start:204 stop:368 length:165 start_codon:yes stop_codon:yes gene_type:complete